jgi:c-di-GMP-binding flagellar brake protein YcgR
LLLSQPLLDEHAIKVAAGDDFLVRGFCGATTYEFNAKVLLVCSQPYPYLHLSFPDQVISFEMRGAVRIKVKLACSVANTLNQLKMPATICDLSTSGVRLQSSVNLGQTGETLQVHFNLAIEHEEHPFMLSAVIRNVAIAENDHLGTYGVEFINLGGADSIALQSCIYILLIDKRSDE